MIIINLVILHLLATNKGKLVVFNKGWPYGDEEARKVMLALCDVIYQQLPYPGESC